MVIYVLNDTTKNVHVPQNKAKKKKKILANNQSISSVDHFFKHSNK